MLIFLTFSFQDLNNYCDEYSLLNNQQEKMDKSYKKRAKKAKNNKYFIGKSTGVFQLCFVQYVSVPWYVCKCEGVQRVGVC